MKLLPTATLTAVAALVAGSAMAQYAPDPYDSPAYGYQAQYQPSDQYPSAAANNVQSYRDYRNALSAYDAARNASAQRWDAYDRDSAVYRANRRAYERRLRAYYRARDAYDAEYGSGAYAIYYGPPPPWD